MKQYNVLVITYVFEGKIQFRSFDTPDDLVVFKNLLQSLVESAHVILVKVNKVKGNSLVEVINNVNLLVNKRNKEFWDYAEALEDVDEPVQVQPFNLN